MGSDLLGQLFYLMPAEGGAFPLPSLLGPSFSHAHPLSIYPQVAFKVVLVTVLSHSMAERNQGNWTLNSIVCIFKTTQGLVRELLESVLGCSFSRWVMSFNALLLDQYHQHHLGARLRCRIAGPTRNRLRQNLQFNRIPKWFSCLGKSEMQCFGRQHSGKFSPFGWLLNVQCRRRFPGALRIS